MNELTGFQSEMDPFGWASSYVSRIRGLGGTQVALESAYTFKTTPLTAPSGNVSFDLKFKGLQASRGALLIEISAGQDSTWRQLKLRTVSLAELAAAGGVERITLTSDQREAYSVAGYIYDDTDAVAQSLSLNVSVNALNSPSADLPMARVARLAGLELPSFAHPTSQTWSREQINEQAFHSACKSLALDAVTASWSAAYIYQATCYLLGDLSGLKGFGAGISADIIANAFITKHADAICHLSLDPVHWPPANNLDFTWLIFEEPLIPVGHLFWMINLLIDRLSPGGVLIIVFTLEHGRMPTEQCDVLKPGDVEIFALRLLAQGHSVAQLKFRAANRPLPLGARTPFGLTVQRAA